MELPLLEGEGAAGGADDGAGAGAFESAMNRAGKLLGIRPRTERELRDRLLAAGFGRTAINQVLERLRGLGLVDDGAFARQWVEERSRRKGLGPRALTAELARKGIGREVAEGALAAAGVEEHTHACVVAERLLGKVGGRTLAHQAARLEQMLLRRGFSAEAAEAGVTAVLPPEGWD